ARALPDAAIDIVVGSQTAGIERLRRDAAAIGPRCHVHVDAADMAGLTAGADLAIGAAGGAAWERCALGLPSLVLTVADNQADNAAALAAAGAAEVLGRAEHVREAELMGRIAGLA